MVNDVPEPIGAFDPKSLNGQIQNDFIWGILGAKYEKENAARNRAVFGFETRSW